MSCSLLFLSQQDYSNIATDRRLHYFILSDLHFALDMTATNVGLSPLGWLLCISLL